MLPFGPAEGVTACVIGGSIVNIADTVQSAVIGPVVYVVPASEPPQPLTLAAYP